MPNFDEKDEIPAFPDPKEHQVLLCVCNEAIWPVSGFRKATVGDLQAGLTKAGHAPDVLLRHVEALLAARPPQIRASCRLNQVERRRLQEFELQHAHPSDARTGADGRFVYRFTDAGIGCKVVVVCITCGVERDASDYESW